MDKCLITTLVFVLITPELWSICPKHELIKPCFCNQDHLYCLGITEADLSDIFVKLTSNLNETEKHFQSITLKNADINELKENTFKDITFDEISLENCKNLTTIDENAFNGTDLVTKVVSLEYNTLLSLHNGSIFDILSKFINVEKIILSNNNKNTEIPSNAFKVVGSQQDKLHSLDLYGPFTKIGRNSFSKLNNLRYLGFEHASFQSIPENAFAFEEPSNHSLVLDFSINPLINTSVFNEKSLLNIERPTKLLFGNACCHKQVTFLDEKVFLPFLLENEKNTIDLLHEEFDCNDCRNYWIKKNIKLLPRLINLKCSNAKQVDNQDNFKSCTN